MFLSKKPVRPLDAVNSIAATQPMRPGLNWMPSLGLSSVSSIATGACFNLRESNQLAVHVSESEVCLRVN